MTKPDVAGVVLMSMGEPERLEDVRPYLRELILDPALVPLSFRGARPLLAWGVSTFGGARLSRSLAAIGGGSPLVRLTLRQAEALEAALRDDGLYKVYAAMRYGRPSADEAARRMAADGVKRVVALPMYPQFCEATSGSSLKNLRDALARAGLPAPEREIRSWADHPGLIAAWCSGISQALAGCGQPAHLLLCAHGLPMTFIARGDPYEAEVGRTVDAVRRAFPGVRQTLAYQSRTGRGRWLSPDAVDEVRRLGRSGIGALVVAALSFVVDNSETLYELDVELEAVARKHGIGVFRRVPAFNDAPAFIATLRDLVLRSGTPA